MIQIDVSGFNPDDIHQLLRAATSSEDRWHAERRVGIGGSDAAAALGISPWKTRLELWHEKTSGTRESLDSMRLRFGHAAERFIFDEYLAKRPETHGALWPQYVVAQHPDYLWMICTPDAVAISSDGCGIVQIKTASAYRREEWEEGPLAHYVVQCIHEMAVTGANWCDLVVMFGAGERLDVHRIARNEIEIAGLIALETQFWGDVQAGTQPGLSQDEAIAGGDDLGRRLSRVFSPVRPVGVELPYQSIAARQRIEELTAEIKQRSEELEGVKNMVRSWIGDCEAGEMPDGSGQWIWKEQERRGYVVEPTRARVLKFSKRKGSA